MSDDIKADMPDMTREEASSQLEAMLLLTEPWTPEQWQTAKSLQRLSWEPGIVYFDGRLWRRQMDELWTLGQTHRQQEIEASMEAVQPMSLDEFKRELVG